MEQTSLNFDSLPLSAEAEAVLMCLSHGRQAARQADDIGAFLGISDRKVRKIIGDMIREDGILIGSATSSPCGFYLPATQEELSEATGKFRHRVMVQLKRLAKLQRATKDMVIDQIRLEWEKEGE